MGRLMIPLENVKLIIHLPHCASDYKLEGRENNGNALFMKDQELTLVCDGTKFQVFIPSEDYDDIDHLLSIVDNMAYTGHQKMQRDKENKDDHKMTLRVSGSHGALSSISFSYERKYYPTRRISVQI